MLAVEASQRETNLGLVTTVVWQHVLLFTAEAQLLAILAPPPPQQPPPQHAPGDPWSAASPMNAFSTVDVSSRVLQPQPGSEEMQRTAAHVQRLLMAGHRLEALRQAYFALCAQLLPGCVSTMTC